MLREQEPRNSFTTVNEPDKGQWTFSDIDEIARFTGAEPVLVDQIYGASHLHRAVADSLGADAARPGQRTTRARWTSSSVRESPSGVQPTSSCATCTSPMLALGAPASALLSPSCETDSRASLRRFALSAATAFMFFRLMRRPTSVTAAQFRGSGKQL